MNEEKTVTLTESELIEKMAEVAANLTLKAVDKNIEKCAMYIFMGATFTKELVKILFGEKESEEK